MKSAVIVAGLILGAPLAALAANANHPYSNVDHRVDAGNNTGDAQVERLNQAQLGGPGLPPPARGYAPPYGAPAQHYAGAGPAFRPGAVPPAAPYPYAAPPYPPVAYAAPYPVYPAPAYVVVPRPFYPPPFFYPY